MFKLFNEQKFHEVDKHIEEVERLYPKRQEKTLFWKACAAARQGKIERAISTLYNGIENGIWWNRYTLTNDPDLTSLQSEDTFKQLIEECDHMFKQEQKISRTQLLNITCITLHSKSVLFNVCLTKIGRAHV